MLKFALLLSTLITAQTALATDIHSKEVLGYISVSGIAETPDTLEMRITKLAKDKLASDWKIISMQINNNSFANAVLYK
ncbi:DUF1471 domain-containing protein [Hafnia paralvei]|uniref:YdgH/BhsA/McbA-like domain containing protein n=1 Tax=Hafnia paralvei TaxID=546367 RepID=UPI000DF2AC0F|nr:YdgH/BhsA/McbA-like domain containing protein [Hafnia paralvei]RDA61894.1 DUF1471 domain-containing protein [Hafnia paralvei]RDA62955.1 DUF1471 domain-containing protein [Hafnia paralvei]RDA63795.1 DUF1471 domain-containing protein [Hafnia paralvei]RDA75081.1 DUF1471 domain-containing protein [Hafnia paralvei]RDA75485.1 DUF1471 domain-containing protein [Hafnia paralvei]